MADESDDESKKMDDLIDKEYLEKLTSPLVFGDPVNPENDSSNSGDSLDEERAAIISTMESIAADRPDEEIDDETRQKIDYLQSLLDDPDKLKEFMSEMNSEKTEVSTPEKKSYGKLGNRRHRWNQ